MTLIIFLHLGPNYTKEYGTKGGGIIFKTNIEFDGEHVSEKDVSVREVINDDRRRVLEISIRAGGILKRHRAAEPITVLCLSGEGLFYAGPDLVNQSRSAAARYSLLTLMLTTKSHQRPACVY
jgi:hypothetical protein